MATKVKKLNCGRCKKRIKAIVKTAYGVRATCYACRIRWTQITGEKDWAAERYHPMNES